MLLPNYSCLLNGAVGTQAAIVSALPVMAGGWIFGCRGGLVAGLLVVAMNTLLLNATGASWAALTEAGHLGSNLVLVVAGTGVGRLREIRDLMARQRLDLEQEIFVRRDAALELERHKSSFNSVVENNSTGILIVDESGVVRFANPAAASLLRRNAQDLVGKTLGIPLVLGEIMEIEVVRKNQELGFAEVRMDETEWQGEGAYLLSLGDITERKRVEESLRELDRMKSDFIDTISHELRTPLHSIKGFNKLILDGMVTDPKIMREFLTTIDQETDRLGKLIDNLLDVSRLNSGRINLESRQLSIEGVIKGGVASLYSLANEQSLTIKEEIPASLPLVLADEERLRQVIVNLLSNAIKFSPSGGRITVRAVQANSMVRVEVIDQGVGIPQEALPHIFERFYRVDSSLTRTTVGTGLGLYISKQVIEAHGGRIWG